jgi:hypothetical protein
MGVRILRFNSLGCMLDVGDAGLLRLFWQGRGREFVVI